MENIDTAYIPEPENTLRPKGNSAKPLIFMILAVIFSGIPGFSNYIISPFREFLSEWTAKIPDGSQVYAIGTVVSISAGIILNFLLTAVSAIVVFLLAYFLYKNIKKAIRFLGSFFLATALANIIKMVLSVVVVFVYDILDAYYAYTFANESEDIYNEIYNEKINELSGYEIITGIPVTIVSLVIAAALGVLIFLVFDGRIKRRKKEKTESPSTPLKSKKKKFGLPEVFMLLSLILSQGVIRLCFYFFRNIVNTVYNTLSPVLINEFIGYENDEYYLFSQAVSRLINNALNNIIVITEAVLILAVIVLFAVLAYKKMKGKALFLGVVFVATRIAWLFVEGPLNGISSLIFTVFNQICQYLYSIGNIDVNSFSISITISSMIMSVAYIAIIALGTAVATVSGVLVLMAVNGKLKRKKAALPGENQ